jgi:hypothetical protein
MESRDRSKWPSHVSVLYRHRHHRHHRRRLVPNHVVPIATRLLLRHMLRHRRPSPTRIAQAASESARRSASASQCRNLQVSLPSRGTKPWTRHAGWWIESSVHQPQDVHQAVLVNWHIQYRHRICSICHMRGTVTVKVAPTMRILYDDTASHIDETTTTTMTCLMMFVVQCNQSLNCRWLHRVDATHTHNLAPLSLSLSLSLNLALHMDINVRHCFRCTKSVTRSVIRSGCID